MINIIIIIVCALCGFLLGRAIQRNVAQKCDFYKDLSRYVDLFKINVTGKQIELAQFNANFAENCSNVFSQYLSVGKFPMRLATREKQDIAVFFDGVASFGSAELIKHLDYYSNIFARISKSAMEVELKRAALYSKLGILLGVMIGILFI